MSPKTTPIAPMTSGASPLRSERVASLSTADRAIRSRLDRSLVGTTGEADIELFELAIEVSPLEAGTFGHATHVALLLAQELLEVDPFERFSGFPQRQLEETRRELGSDRGRRKQSRIAQEPSHVLGCDLAVHGQREIRDHAVELIEVGGPVAGGERGNGARRERRLRALARRYLAPEAVDERRDVLATLAQRRKHNSARGQRCKQCRIEAAIGGEVSELLAAAAHQESVVPLQLRNQEGEALLLGARVRADLAAIEHAVARFLEKLQRARDEPRAALERDERRVGHVHGARGDVVPGTGLADDQDRPRGAHELLDRPFRLDHRSARAQLRQRNVARRVPGARLE